MLGFGDCLLCMLEIKGRLFVHKGFRMFQVTDGG